MRFVKETTFALRAARPRASVQPAAVAERGVRLAEILRHQDAERVRAAAGQQQGEGAGGAGRLVELPARRQQGLQALVQRLVAGGEAVRYQRRGQPVAQDRKSVV